jgi:ribosomal protein L29
MQNQQKVKAFELRKQDETVLVNNLNKFRAELVGLRTSKVSSAPQVKLARIRVSILTIVRSNTLFFAIW